MADRASPGTHWLARARGLGTFEPQRIPELVDTILAAARDCGSTDIHLTPASDRMVMSWRIDGVLHEIAALPSNLAPNVVARLKVLAHLLTYRSDVPQEGRIRTGDVREETRVSTFPTLFGERAVVRLFAVSGRFERLHDLGLPVDVERDVRQRLEETSGVLLVTGPAGSGKTTTLYACLREIVDKSRGQRSLMSLEDPIESVVPGVAQSQVNLPAGFDLASGLKSLLRQDPEVIMLGEIRDRTTADAVLQASMTGHLVLTTFHAGSAAQAASRLLDMGLEPYSLRSGIRGIVSQRLVRQSCTTCRTKGSSAMQAESNGSEDQSSAGCPECGGTGYRGRMVIAEYLSLDSGSVGRAILERHDTAAIVQKAKEAGMITQGERGAQAVREGRTTLTELRRVLGDDFDREAPS